MQQDWGGVGGTQLGSGGGVRGSGRGAGAEARKEVRGYIGKSNANAAGWHLACTSRYLYS